MANKESTKYGGTCGTLGLSSKANIVYIKGEICSDLQIYRCKVYIGVVLDTFKFNTICLSSTSIQPLLLLQ